MIIGHQKQWRFLKRSLELGRLSHAYLFLGQKSLGKKNLALEFIKLINCEDSNEDKPCSKCNFCKMIEKKNHPDFLIVSPSGTGIQISQIRRLQQFLSLRPYWSNWKLVVLDEAEKMTKEAQSCLLKTLEEAKEGTILILISDFADLLLPTIRSRCQLIKFFPVSRLEIKNYLLGQGLSEKKSEFLASLSAGLPGRAINFLSNPQKLEKENQVLKEVSKIYYSDLAWRLKFVKNLGASKEETKDILEILQRYLRSVLLSVPLEKNSQKESAAKVKKNIKFIEELNYLIFSTNINPKLALEALMTEL